MTTIHERLQRKREPLDKWSTKEQLSLAFAVARSGDQNWMSVSRALKPFGDPNRPGDWFHQKNCAAQYGALLENVETPKRKKRISGVEPTIETPSESILRRLLHDRKQELRKLMDADKKEFQKLQEDMTLLKSGKVSEEQLDLMCKQIDEEEQQKEKEAQAHAQWLKERELRKQEIERAWRPIGKINMPVIGQKRKPSDALDSLLDIEQLEGRITPTQTPEPSKPALSPLLTSLLKSPSHAQNVVTSSILHSAITSQRPINSNTNPTIASLLNSSAAVQVSPGLQQLVSSAISQEPVNNIKDTLSSLLDTADSLPNLKDIESSILSGDDPLPEIKNEVDVIISDLIENADIVTDPEQHLLEGNDDIIADFENELEELVNKENAVAEAAAAAEAAAKEDMNKLLEKSKDLPEVDPFEFQEDPEVFEPSKPSCSAIKPTPIPSVSPTPDLMEETSSTDLGSPLLLESDIKKEPVEISKIGNNDETIPGSVEIVEVVVMEDEEISKELNKTQIQDIVHSLNVQDLVKEETKEDPTETNDEDTKTDKEETISEATSESMDLEIKTELNEIKETDVEETSRRNTFTPEYSEDIFDDMSIEVTKLDKAGKAKRDYSRTKKKDDTEFDILLEQAVSENLEEESLSEKDDDKKSESSIKAKLKIENERSNSPWTEEEEISNMRTRRRYSTPATPVDSIPNSPASSTAYFDDDKDFKNWKKPIMLVYSRLAAHKYASLFSKPITNEHAPGYHTIVKRPMDLQTIRKNLESGAIRTTAEFQRDVLLMLNNAIMYNKTDDTVYKMAQEMQEEGVEQIRILLQVQNESTSLARRETRTSEGPGNKRKRIGEDILRNKKRKED